MPEAMERTYEELKTGESFSFEVLIDEDLVAAFRQLSGDRNPLHEKTEYARASSFGKPVVHGMIAGAFFSRLVGMHLPGKFGLYLSQTLHFRKPIFFGDKVTIRGEILEKSEAMKTIRVKTEALTQDGICTDGEALVRLLK
ncbi:MAG: MaoC family dehydratase [Candidatus Sungbacteria bacterium]|uniref:MaoC family dehydratase n=1 Tax=Candidatus Sungiibacteriota bacterium TaxID=2750080 RepID=A0A9D6QTJ1_9BACT|nr:MaoC family dehydratase [Candidatus Sungbacteria bacterium]